MNYPIDNVRAKSTSAVVGVMLCLVSTTTAAETHITTQPTQTATARSSPMQSTNTVTSDVHDIGQVAQEVIRSLLDERDYLGYMVERAAGRIDDDTMDALTDQYTKTVPISDHDLRAKTLALAALVGTRIDSELVASVFRCDFMQAQKVLSSFRDGQHG